MRERSWEETIHDVAHDGTGYLVITGGWRAPKQVVREDTGKVLFTLNTPYAGFVRSDSHGLVVVSHDDAIYNASTGLWINNDQSNRVVMWGRIQRLRREEGKCGKHSPPRAAFGDHHAVLTSGGMKTFLPALVGPSRARELPLGKRNTAAVYCRRTGGVRVLKLDANPVRCCIAADEGTCLFASVRKTYVIDLD